jgi:hypothetical protein
MSLMQAITATCPNCGTIADSELVSSINADRRPDLREDVLQNRLQVITCATCGTEFRVVPALSYVDFERNQWILVHPPAALEEWQALETEARAAFDDTFGPKAPKPAQDVGANMSPRITFGWPALREKLLCRELDLNDIDLELMKMAVMRNVPGMPADDSSELRLVGHEDDKLTFSWIVRDTGTVLNSVQVPRALYDDVIKDTAWAPLRQEIESGAFVDLNRLMLV